MSESILRVFTAFSGYDSQCMALDKLNIKYDLVGWSEIDKYAIIAHNLIYPQYKDRNYGDISKIDWSRVPDFDLFTYSSPCQDFSVLGNQKGGNEGSGTRSSLLWECRKAILAKKPKYLILENVEALVTKKFINLFNEWISELGDYGYTSYWEVLNSKNYGIPHSRNRVFLVSILRENDNDFPLFNFPKEIELKTKLVDLLERNVDESYYLSEERLDKYFYVKNDKAYYKDKEVRPNETFYWNTSLNFADESVKGDICKCLKTDNAVAILERNVKCVDNGTNVYDYRIRKLTPKECFRLMGVEEKNIDIIQNSNKISENQQHKLAGNSIVVDVLENLFRKLLIDKENDYGNVALF